MTDNLKVSDNHIKKVGENGIELDTVTKREYFVEQINNTGSNGILAANSDDVLIDSNKIGLHGSIGNDGILVNTYSTVETPLLAIFPIIPNNGAPNTGITITNNIVQGVN